MVTLEHKKFLRSGYSHWGVLQRVFHTPITTQGLQVDSSL
jgi:hypothetical protein